jgi:hypothetical protein
MEDALEKGFEFEGAGNVLLDFGELARGKFFPAGADRGVIAEAAKEELDLAKGETHLACEADEEHAVEGVAGVAALATAAVGRGKKAHFFVVADGRGVEVGASGELADFHLSFPSLAERWWKLLDGLAARFRPEKRQHDCCTPKRPPQKAAATIIFREAA